LELPILQVPEFAFTPGAVIAVSLPLTVLALGLGNVQGLGFLLAQGYRVPIDRITVVVGINSIANSFLGGHQATVARTGVAIVAGRDAGPLAQRYWANLVAAALTVVIAVAASAVASLLGVLPATFVLALAGLAILAAFQDAVGKAFGTELRFGALVAFAVAATPFALANVTSDFWAIVAGVVASLLVERPEIVRYWRDGAESRRGIEAP
jgi:benzoate membrane transport protein